MHFHPNFKRRAKTRQKVRRTVLFSLTGIFLSALFYAGIFTPINNPEAMDQDSFRPPGAMPLAVPFAPLDEEAAVRIENTVKKGETILTILTREGVAQPSAYQFFTEIKPIYDLKRISAGNQFTLFLSKESNEVQRFKYEIDPVHYLEAWRDKTAGGYRAKLTAIPYLLKKEFISGAIRESLFASILDAGEKPELADMMASLYEYDIDFNRDIQKGDSFALLVEKMYLEGEFIRYGNVLAVEFTNRGKTVWVIRYTDPEGKAAYYHPDGRSVRKVFLKCPLPFMRVTSRYGSRHHPLLGYSARHRGVDLAAPLGTPVRATAAGIVSQKGISSSKGQFIAIRHTNHYVSHYYHLSRFAKGIRPGVRIAQGQIIGYVGSTGWATGPHLHYGLQKNGSFLNPLSLESPTKEPLKKIYLEEFKQYAARVSLLLSGSQIVKIPDYFTEALLEPAARPLVNPVGTSISAGR
jgi:murein DD-endopeptidase MepM/ murein hydrolase activator NlpD